MLSSDVDAGFDPIYANVSDRYNAGFLGRGIPHERIEDYLGDYILISNSNLNIRYSVNGEKKAHIADHGGITMEEMMVPLIVLDCNREY